jgi:hypothetical protein
MIKVVAALVATVAGLAMLLSFKSHTAGPARSALTGKTVAGAPQTPGATSGTSTKKPSSSGSTGGGNGNSSGGSTGSTGGTGGGSGGSGAGPSGTFTGSTVNTPYGDMQVAAVLHDGKLTDVQVLQQTDVGGRSQEIDAAALPILHTEAIAANSANIDIVSGATYTSQGYAQSLQAAIDAAGH